MATSSTHDVAPLSVGKAVHDHKPTRLWPESLDTPGYIPRHLMRRVTDSFPILEVLQRLLIRLPSSATNYDLEKVLALIALYQIAQPAYNQLKGLCISAFTVQVTILENDPAAKDVLAWMGEKVIMNSHTRSAMLVTGGIQNADNEFYRGGIMPPPLPRGARGPAPAIGDAGVQSLPSIGSRFFFVGLRPFIFSRSGNFRVSSNGPPVNQLGQLPHSLSIMTLGWNLKPLQDFVNVCQKYRRKNLLGITTIYYAIATVHDRYGEKWQSVQKTTRKLDTIDMDETVKSDLIRDAEYYYSNESRQFFADCGIPYRRGYLFHGPPGTGKSSFSAALAGHLRCDIYHINLASGTLDDSGLHRLFLDLPRKCIVVIEDIDSAGIDREMPSVRETAVTAQSDTRLPNGLLQRISVPSKGARVTLSGLLNAIDGNASQEGRLLIMTSNNPNALDSALTRPGRIDKKVYFGNMNKAATESIFKRLIGRSAYAHDALIDIDQISQYAKDFASKVPADTFTPAQIQNFLSDCRGDHIKAIAEIDAWVEENRHGDVDRYPSSNVQSSDVQSNDVQPIAVQNTPMVNGVNGIVKKQGDIDTLDTAVRGSDST